MEQKTSLWDMNQQMMAIDSLLSENTDPETQEILESAKDQLCQDIEGKMENILGYIAECKSRVEYYKTEEERIASKRKGIENRIDWLKGLVYGQMKLTNRQKAEYGTYNVSVVKTPDKVVLTDDAAELLPDDLCRITRLPNKTAIKEKMGEDGVYKVSIDGRDIVLATIESGNETIRIR